MPRPTLAEDHIHPAIRDRITNYYAKTIGEVQAAVATSDVVIVGMGINPFPRKARRLLDAGAIPYKYLGYGSYLGEWKRRLALKMWAGWPTFPMVFVKGTLVGGAHELGKMIESGELKRLLSSGGQGRFATHVP